MSIEYAVDVGEAYVKVVASGSADNVRDLLGYIDSFVAECDKAGNRRILLDHRDLEVSGDQVTSYEVAAESIGKLSAEAPYKVALVSRPERMQFARIYETIGHNRGLAFKAFDDVHIAAAWLNA